MRDFQKNKGFRKILRSRFLLIFLCALVLIFSYSIFGLVGKMNEAKRNKQIAETKLLELEKSKEKLKYDISKLGTAQGVEASIREKFGLAKEGEGLVVVVEEKEPENNKEEPESRSFFQFLSGLFD